MKNNQNIDQYNKTIPTSGLFVNVEYSKLRVSRSSAVCFSPTQAFKILYFGPYGQRNPNISIIRLVQSWQLKFSKYSKLRLGAIQLDRAMLFQLGENST